jgi:hypothetical protein
MRQRNERRHSWRRALVSLGIGGALCVTGCQVDVGGQTLPNPYYQTDDIQYFPPGPEFKLAEEAAMQEAFKEDQAAEQR